MNELAFIFGKMGIPTMDVLEAAGTKWNFLKFSPGLVSGYCIGVDPYYLTYKAEEIGYHPQVILSGRRINDGMGKYVAENTIKRLIQADKPIRGARVLVLGITFKEDAPDIRNSKVIDIVRELEDYGVDVLVCDPLACPDETRNEYEVELVSIQDASDVDAVVLAVAHKAFVEMTPAAFRKLHRNKGKSGVMVDVKTVLNSDEIKQTGMSYWSL